MKEGMTTLGESCQFFNGKAHEKDIDAEGAYVVVNSKFISQEGRVLKFTGKQMFPLFEDDIVMVMSDVPNGKALAKCYIIEENDKYSLNQRICAIRTTEFNIRFLYYQLNRHSYLLAFNNGENQSNLRKDDILNCPLWKPSLEVQAKIVELLDETLAQLDKAKTNIELNLKNTEDFFQSKLNDIFSQKCVGCDEKTFQELSTRIGDGLHGTPNYDENGDYYFINGNNLNDGVIEIKENTKKVNKEEFEKNKRELTKNTVLISINGTLGNVAFYNDEPVILGKSACYINFKKEVNKHYIKYLVKSPLFFKNMASLSTGATIKNFSLKSMRNYSLYLPAIKEQELIVNELIEIEDNILSIKEQYEQKANNLEDLKQSILQKAFAGELSKKLLITI